MTRSEIIQELIRRDVLSERDDPAHYHVELHSESLVVIHWPGARVKLEIEES